jgi:hypothetical protein
MIRDSPKPSFLEDHFVDPRFEDGENNFQPPPKPVDDLSPFDDQGDINIVDPMPDFDYNGDIPLPQDFYDVQQY